LLLEDRDRVVGRRKRLRLEGREDDHDHDEDQQHGVALEVNLPASGLPGGAPGAAVNRVRCRRSSLLGGVDVGFLRHQVPF
jgi:hypothetical protein